MAQMVHTTPRPLLPDFRQFKLGNRQAKRTGLRPGGTVTPGGSVPRGALPTGVAGFSSPFWLYYNGESKQTPPLLPVVAVDNYTGNPDHSALGNDAVGDCVAAGQGHWANQISWLEGKGSTVTEDDALALYKLISGWNGILNSPTDTGSENIDALNVMLVLGLAGIKSAAWAPTWIDPLEPWSNMKWCIYLFLGCMGGLSLPESAYTQINAGQPWSVVPNSPIVGGHETYFVGFDPNYFYINTWGFTQRVTPQFVNTYYNEMEISCSQNMVGLPHVPTKDLAQMDENWTFCTDSPQMPFERPVQAA
jgi:hypothetical protein